MAKQVKAMIDRTSISFPIAKYLQGAANIKHVNSSYDVNFIRLYRCKVCIENKGLRRQMKKHRRSCFLGVVRKSIAISERSLGKILLGVRRVTREFHTRSFEGLVMKVLRTTRQIVR